MWDQIRKFSGPWQWFDMVGLILFDTLHVYSHYAARSVRISQDSVVCKIQGCVALNLKENFSSSGKAVRVKNVETQQFSSKINHKCDHSSKFPPMLCGGFSKQTDVFCLNMQQITATKKSNSYFLWTNIINTNIWS